MLEKGENAEFIHFIVFPNYTIIIQNGEYEVENYYLYSCESFRELKKTKLYILVYLIMFMPNRSEAEIG